jgi:hypothetical protein
MSEMKESSLTAGEFNAAPFVLKNCPFCGCGKIEIWGTYQCFAQCTHCRITGPHQHTHEEAATAWNTRRPHHEDVLAEAACRAVACLKEWRKEGDIADDVSAAIMFPDDGAAQDTERSGH